MPEPVYEAARRYLEGLHSTLWGETFNIYDEKDSAAEWLAGEVRAVLRELDSPRWTDKLGW